MIPGASRKVDKRKDPAGWKEAESEEERSYDSFDERAGSVPIYTHIRWAGHFLEPGKRVGMFNLPDRNICFKPHTYKLQKSHCRQTSPT